MISAPKFDLSGRRHHPDNQNRDADCPRTKAQMPGAVVDAGLNEAKLTPALY